MKIFNFRIEENILEEFKEKYKNKNLSERIRQLILSDLSEENILKIKSGDWKSLDKVLSQSPALQVVGSIGDGKTYTIQKLIQNNGSKIFIVFDAHQEYKNLPIIDSISDKLRKSCRIQLPTHPASARGLFPLYTNQILSKKWDDKFIFVVEESHRYKEIKGLLSESRKFAKIIAISPNRLVDFCPVCRIIRK